MKRILPFILIMTLVCAVLTAGTPAGYGDLQKILDDFFTNYKTAFSGSVLVAYDGKIILKKAMVWLTMRSRFPIRRKRYLKSDR
ncbi:MAG: hypothetical protein ACM3TR_02220 [Caulobacteraceae bacterium]